MHAPQVLDHRADGMAIRLGDGRAHDPRSHNEEVAIGTLRLLWRNRWRFVLIAILSLLLATLFLRVGPRTYSAESVIRFDFGGSTPSANTPRLSLEAAAVIDSEARIARSRTVAERVVSRLGLTEDPIFSAPPGPLTQAIHFIDGTLDDVNRQPDTSATSRSETFNLAVERVMAGATIERDNKSYLITIRFLSASAQIATKLADALAQEYLHERQSQSLIATKARLRAELSQIGIRFGDKFPAYLAAQSQLDEIERVVNEPNRSTTPIRSAALGDFTADIVIPAQVLPAQVSPNPKSVYTLSLMGGLILAAAIMLLRQRYDTRLSNEWAVANRLGLRCFGSMPDGINWRASSRAILLEAARSIAVASGLDVKEPSCRVVVLTSSLPNEGKTLLATLLASALADSGQRVLVVDAIPQAPTRQRPHSLPLPGRESPPHGPETAASRFQVVPMPERGSMLASPDGFAEYMRVVRQKHDVVIIKAPPVLMLSDARRIARHADILMLLVHWRKTPARIAVEALRRLHEAGAPASGAVLTNIRLQRQANATLRDQSYYLLRYSKFYASISS
jgi:Mrp family chromosome partitioning ATPase